MAENPTTGELYKAKTITGDEIEAAADVFLCDPTVSTFRFESGHTLNVSASVEGHAWSKSTVANPEATEHLKRQAVRTAILLARPEKG
jgi:hypothetical protein